MATIDATVGGASSNAYCSLAEAASYLDERLYTDDWDDATTDNQTRAVIWATKLIDTYTEWEGRKKDQDQALDWPRQSVYDKDGYIVADTIIPQDIKDAAAELAMALLAEDRTAEPDSVGLNRLQVDVIELEYDKADRDQYGTIPETVRKIIEPVWGAVQGRSISQAKLIRV
jgi:hypothetical protein